MNLKKPGENDDYVLWVDHSVYHYDQLVNERLDNKRKEEVINLQEHRLEHLLLKLEMKDKQINRLESTNERQKSIIQGDNEVRIGDVG